MFRRIRPSSGVEILVLGKLPCSFSHAWSYLVVPCAACVTVPTLRVFRVIAHRVDESEGSWAGPVAWSRYYPGTKHHCQD
jgi:hypothetical protein